MSDMWKALGFTASGIVLLAVAVQIAYKAEMKKRQKSWEREWQKVDSCIR